VHIKVLFFGLLKEICGGPEARINLPEGSTAGAVFEHYATEFPKLRPMASSIVIARNHEFASPREPLAEGDEVALLPPVSGGAPDSGPHAPIVRVSLARERIDAHTAVTSLERPEDGALVIFDGMVRNNTRGRRTLYLIYEAYEQMALAQMRELARRSLADFAIRDVAIVHRLGRIEVGESSVLIAVASAHRAAAFDACRWLIDTLKKTVPIWKKEHFEDGAVWADGEPFPAEIAK
jgi:molybdopterin synthase catalytic subunit